MREAMRLVDDGAVSIGDAQTITGLGRTTLYAAMARGELPFIKIGAARRIPRRALTEWMAKHLMVGDERVTDAN